MLLTVALLVTLGLVGSLDIGYFHIWKFRLARQPSSRLEHLTHLARGVLFLVELGLLLSAVPQGAWFWAVAALLVLDFWIEVADVLLEPSSRRPLGGLPPLEYFIHMNAAILTGGVAASYLILGWPNRLAPTSLASIGAGVIPWWLAAMGWLMVAVGGLLWLFEAGTFVSGPSVSAPPLASDELARKATASTQPVEKDQLFTQPDDRP